MPEFNLVDEKWIPSLMSEGRQFRELSLRDCLLQAHYIQEVFDNSPLVTVALHRLLLAVIHAGFRHDEKGELHRGPRSFEEWKQLWSAKKFDELIINAYLDKWKHRFNLFDPERPFYQVTQMSKSEPVEFNPASLLAHEAATGNNATLFDHGFEDSQQAFSAAEASRYLIAHQAFSVGGGVSHPFNLSNAPMVNGYTVLVKGENLFETLLLNLIVYTDERPIPIKGEDAPVWEQEVLELPNKKGTQPHGYLDYLTWQSRQIRLQPEAAEPSGTMSVRQCQRLQNLKLSDDHPLFDPFKSYEKSKEKGYRARDITPSKAGWRDSHALFQQNDAQQPGRMRPVVFDSLGSVEQARQRGEIEAKQSYSFVIYGFANDKASVFLWSRERMPLPLSYLNDPDLVQSLEGAITLAEKIYECLKESIKTLALGLATKEDVGKVADSFGADELYWSRLDAPFRKLLVNLPKNNPVDEREWARVLEKTAEEALTKIINGLNGSAKSFRAATEAETEFSGAMGRTRRKSPNYFPQAQTRGAKQ